MIQRWLYRLFFIWKALGQALHRWVSPLVLTLMYFLLITPWAYCYRRFNRRTPWSDPSRLGDSPQDFNSENFLNPF
jgi:hypothetical protein